MHPIISGGQLGYIDSSGALLFTTAFEHGGSFSEDCAGVRRNGLWGFIDMSGSLVVPCVFEKVSRFRGGVCAVREGGKWGFVNKSGDWTVKPAFAGVGSFCDGLAAVQGKILSSISFIDMDGEVAIKDVGKSVICDFSEGLTRAYSSKRKGHGFIDVLGKWAIAPLFDLVFDFSEGLAGVQKTGAQEISFVDRVGEVKIELPYVSTDAVFSEGRAIISKRDRAGFVSCFVDTCGSLVSDLWFSSLGRCIGGMTEFKKKPDGLYGFLDRDMHEVIRPRFTSVTSFKDGLAWVSEEGCTGYINRAGEYVWRLS